MTYSSSGPSLAQVLDMDMDMALDMDQDSPSRNRDRDTIHVDQSPSTLSRPKSPSFSSSDLSELQSFQHHSRSASNHRHDYDHSRSTKSEKSITHNLLHRAHLQLHRLETVDDKTSDEPADHSHSQLHKTGHHSHHSHQRLHRSISPANLHRRAATPDNAQAHAHADSNALKPRAEQDLFTQVVQTVSVIQVVDAAGSPIEVQTHFAPPATVVVDSASGITVAAISDPEPKLSAAAAASDPAQAPAAAESYNAPSSPAAAPTAVETPGLTNPLPSAQIPDATVSDSVPEPVNDTTVLPTADLPSDLVPPTNSVTSTDPDFASQETTSPAAPTTDVDTTVTDASGSETLVTTDDLSATTTEEPTTQIETITSDLTSETTQPTEETSEATAEATTEVTQSEPNRSTTTIPTISNTATRARSSSTVIVVSSTFVTSSINPTLSTQSYSDSVYSSISAQETWSSGWWGADDSEGSVGGAAGDATADNPPPAPTNTSATNETDTGTLSPQQKQVIGGVVGGVTGVAFLAFFVLFALRYKKKHPEGGLLGGNLSATRTISGPTSGPDGGSMAERSSASTAVTAVLAGLVGKKQQQPAEPAPASERGFYRVSGKKLPSVLQAGGDGYSDPRTEPPSSSGGRANRESVMSGTSDYWRGSMAWDPNQQESHHLALGTPMRPISGVPVIRSGPARTPVTESNPFTDPPKPKPEGDGLGGSTGAGSVTSRDGSFGSPSRFQERI
ncbi:hypothetical protein SNK03_008111 [Fusarium graminearum]|uniref:Uncharacterized protein n=1 Tax=Gibberella zeae TaxID=5518 RepID=A0A2H3FMP6_GIBZA|nr:hypothetical protein FG05_06809 [Fusarium graminearum]KAI6767237.1 hypothetical protein HG531_011597 [Fusarium graminearum]PCD19730.1 hypothetical protein FGRA07_05479 [Fusarium graminearum]CAF3472595.1 unnamed protein product [Fusarium graminearum]CAF3507645.1 unnamed protein product [Fusarium graminearum]